MFVRLARSVLDGDRIARAIELTRFRVPDDDDHAETDSELGLVRATDLIGQLADPRYPQKAECAVLRVRGNRNRQTTWIVEPSRSGRYLSNGLQCRAVYRPWLALLGPHIRGPAMDRKPALPVFAVSA
jgi:hypothetical protein